MANFRRLLTALLALFPMIYGLVIVDSVVASSCIYYIKQFNWGCNSTGNSAPVYTCRCGNIDWLGSITNCIYEKSSSFQDRDHGLAHISKRCKIKSKGLYDYSVEHLQDIYQNASIYILYPNSSKDVADLITHPLGVNVTEFKYYQDTFEAVMNHVTKTQWFGWGLNFYWLLIIILSIIYNVLQNKVHNGYFNKIKSKFVQSPLFRRHYNAPYYIADLIPILIPLKSEFFTICIFWILVIIFTIISYDIMLPNAYLGNSKFYNLLDFISYRTSILSFSLLPSIYLMGIRNSPLSYFVSWERRTLLSYHKTISLAMSLLAFIHSCVWTAYANKEGDYSMWAADAYWKWGIVAMILLGLIIAFSFQIFRIVLYDTFLILHHLFSGLFIVSIYYHANSLGWMGWCYSIITIYCWDKFIRIIKIAKSGKLVKSANVEYFDDNIIKLSIPKIGGLICPGNYVYLYFLSPKWFLNGWQSHPFSLYQDPTDSETFIVLIKIKGGITRKIYKWITKISQSQEIIHVPVLTEGMYGKSVSMYFNYNEYCLYVLIASGTGISSVFPFIQEILRNTCENNLEIRLIWVIHSLNEILWFEKEIKFLIDNYCQDDISRLRIEIIVTAKDLNGSEFSIEYNSNIVVSNNTASQMSKKVLELPNENIMQYTNNRFLKISKLPDGKRPSLKKMVDMHKIKSTTQFISCGPPAFCDGIRRFINQHRDLSGNNFRIDYHDLSYIW